MRKRTMIAVAAVLMVGLAGAACAPRAGTDGFGAEGAGSDGEQRLQQEIRAGDVVWIPPNVRHWHGAAATTSMSHVAIAEALDGKVSLDENASGPPLVGQVIEGADPDGSAAEHDHPRV